MTHNPVVSKAFLHRWEEPCISGTKGSGTVFFAGCNMRCVYCQNYRISQECFGKEITVEQLASIFTALQNKGAHNINLVNPTHFIRQIIEAAKMAKNLHIPIVYNSNGYDAVKGLELLKGTVKVYLPDIKYISSEIAWKYSGARDYFEVASTAVLEMYRQVGAPVFDEEGIVQKGMLIRHLILPGLASESIRILDWIKENLPNDVYISLMSQYTPYHRASQFPEINRRIIRREYEKVLNHFFKLGFENGYVQERDSAEEQYIPDFNLEGVDMI